jgi:pyruvate, orthophosphate dikinase
MGISHEHFSEKLEEMKVAKGVKNDTDLTADDLKELVIQYKEVYAKAKGEPFPTGKFTFTFPSNYIFLIISYSFIKINLLWNSCADPKKQLSLAVLAVFDSWDSPRAKKYRSINKITGLRGTAVNVQCMVFGNMGNTSGTGVLFTRNPSTGEKKLYGEYLINAQGEDVVAGIRTPQELDAMKDCLPQAYKELVENCSILESHYKDMMVYFFSNFSPFIYFFHPFY